MEDRPATVSRTKSLSEWLRDIHSAIDGGELLEAYDLAENALNEFRGEPRLEYAAILALARAGATRQARQRYEQSRLAEAAGTNADSAFRVDLESLDARIAKDEALEATGAARESLLAKAASRYNEIFRRTGDYYPGINAATLSLLRGDTKLAESLAIEVLARCDAARARDATGSYYLRATEAEAALILNRHEHAVRALEDAAGLHSGNLSAVATTRRQLRLVCEARGIPQSILRPLTLPGVIHFSGHMIGARFPAPAEEAVRSRIADLLDRHAIGFGYGSLAAGADILFAEELLRRNAELNVALPFNIDEFKRVSVAPSGDQWLGRFDRCLRGARTITYATTDEFLGDDSLFVYASRIAMGLAILRSRSLDTSLRQVAVWNGEKAPLGESSAGASGDVSFWRGRGLPCDIINPNESLPDFQRHEQTSRKPPAKRAPNDNRRTIRAMLFGDVKGFSTLREVQMPIFAREVLGRFARVLDRHARDILFRNTWGDGLYVVAKNVETAAECAIELQDELTNFVPTEHGLPEYIGLRLGGHLGPVFRLRDPVLKRNNFIGAHVSRTARIEPVTPEGAVYVTEAFAAVLATAGAGRFVCEYVGQVPAAKHYGTMRMYLLRRSAIKSTAG